MNKEIPGRVIHGGTYLWYRKHSGRPILDFSANLNPFPPEIPWEPDPAVLSSYPDDRYEALREAIGRTFHRRPEEIAAAVLWLCSDEASFAIGSIFSVDGGVVAR